MLILDLESPVREQYTRTNSYFGQPFVYNTLFNFGGNYILYDKVATMNTGVFDARNMTNSSMVGTGFAPEGLGNTYIGTEFLAEMAWRKEPVQDLPKWASGYAKRRYDSQYCGLSIQFLAQSKLDLRYGQETPGANTAYGIMVESVFSSKGGFERSVSSICAWHYVFKVRLTSNK